MSLSRRKFLAAAGAASTTAVGSLACSGEASTERARRTGTAPFGGPIQKVAPDRLDPWIELDPAAFRNNLEFLAEWSQKPIVAVLKCHGYGLDQSAVVAGGQ